MKIIFKLGFLSLLAGLIAFTSCKNDFDVNGPLSTKLAVYGLMNYADSAHYLKIYKVFAAEGSVYETAQNMDNYLLYDSIEVTVLETLNGNTIYHRFDTTTSVPKDSGIFSNPSDPHKQVLYVNYDVISPNSTCILQIKNKYTGNIMAESTCDLVYPYDVLNPFPIVSNVLAIASTNGVLITNTEFLLKAPAHNAVRYQAYFDFYYFENDGGIETYKGPVQITLGTAKTLPEGEVKFQWNPSSFFSTLMRRIPLLDNNSAITRRFGAINLTIWAADKTFSDYIEASNGSSMSIIEERPTVSNISNGLGIYASRFSVIKTGLTLSPSSLNILATNPNYTQLHFRN